MCVPLLSTVCSKKKHRTHFWILWHQLETNPNLWLIITRWEMLAIQYCDPPLGESWAPYQQWTMCAWVTLAWLCLPHVYVIHTSLCPKYLAKYIQWLKDMITLNAFVLIHTRSTRETCYILTHATHLKLSLPLGWNPITVSVQLYSNSR